MQFYEGAVSAARELRYREAVMGTTADARRDLRIAYVSDEVDEADRDSLAHLDDLGGAWRARTTATQARPSV